MNMIQCLYVLPCKLMKIKMSDIPKRRENVNYREPKCYHLGSKVFWQKTDLSVGNISIVLK